MFRIPLSALVLGAAIGLGPVPLAMVLPVSAAASQSAAPQSAASRAAIALHDAARAGKGDPGAAVAASEAVTEAEPDNALAWAYLGSSYAISAREAGSVTDKIRFTNRGLRYLDQAVDMAPQDPVVRLIRASVLPNLPAMFGRSEMAQADMLEMDRLYSAAPDPALAGPMVRIYAALAETGAGAQDWAAKAEAARALAETAAQISAAGQ